MTSTLSINKPKVSIGVQAIATVIAVITAVALPQLFHVLGKMSGLGKGLGVAFCPMHLPVILVGLLAGPFAGAITGALSPVISSLLTGMPSGPSLPLMVVELFAYGLVAGLLRNVRMPSIVKVLIVQIAGRATRMLAVIIALQFFGLNPEKFPVMGIWLSVPKTIIGIILQLTLIPLIVFWVRHLDADKQ